MITLPGAVHEQTLSLLPLEEAATTLAELRSAGWIATDTDTTIQVSWSGCEDVTNHVAALASLRAAFVNVEVVGSRDGRQLRLRVVGSTMEVVEIPEAPPEALFDDHADLELASQAWDRDADAALLLPMMWSITADLALERVLSTPSGIELRVMLTSDTVRNIFLDQGLTTAEQLVPLPGMRRVYLALNASAQPVHLSGVTFAGLINLPDDGNLTLPSAAAPLDGENLVKGLPWGLPRPTALVLDRHYPPDVRLPWQDVIDRCQAFAALATWTLVANNVQVNQDCVQLEVLGFKRITLILPDPDLLSPAICAETLDLRAWAFHDASPDRLLALRQVISLYQGEEVFAHAIDIRDSAEVIYVGLRSNAVAEVVKSSREAQRHAQETVRQTLKSVQDLLKSTMERFLASLVAIAAVLIANVNHSLPDNISRNLLLLTSAFLAMLALFAIFVEGPLVSLPLKNLTGDLRDGTTLLTESQRNGIADMASVSSTRSRVRLVRFVVPGLYVAVAVLIVLFGKPGLYK